MIHNLVGSFKTLDVPTVSQGRFRYSRAGGRAMALWGSCNIIFQVFTQQLEGRTVNHYPTL